MCSQGDNHLLLLNDISITMIYFGVQASWLNLFLYLLFQCLSLAVVFRESVMGHRSVFVLELYYIKINVILLIKPVLLAKFTSTLRAKT